jgi:CubicO group peptidase (beta-lactamase class C family)
MAYTGPMTPDPINQGPISQGPLHWRLSAQLRTVVATLILAALILISGFAAALDSDSIQTRLDSALAEIDRRGISVIVALSYAGGPIDVREFGLFAVDGVPAEETQVDILSITKSITAISVLKLVETGDLSLTEPLGAIFAGVPEDKEDITVHQLLTHSSGLLDSCGDDHDRLTKAAFLQCALQSTLMSQPGTEYLYSNVGFSVLAAIIEERSGKSFETFLADDVLAGIAVRNTGYSTVVDDSRSMRTADSQPISTSSWGGHDPFWNLIGNGGLISTAEEFLLIRRALSAGTIIPLELVEIAETAHVAEDPEGVSYYGYGVVVQENSSVGPLVWHNGGSAELSSDWSEMVDYDLSIFAAGLQTDDMNAYEALDIVRRHLSAD